MQSYCDHCNIILCDNRCANCLEANYCSRECQLANWSSHKTYCQLSKKLTSSLHEITQKMLGDIHIVYANASLSSRQPVNLIIKLYMTAEEFMYNKRPAELATIMIDKNAPGENDASLTKKDEGGMNFKLTFNFKDMKKTITIMSPPNIEGIVKRHPGATFMPVML